MSTSGGGRGRSARNTLSLALFGLAAILFVVVVVIYFRDHKKEQAPQTPANVPGQAQLKNVVDALKAQGITIEYSREAGPRIPFLSPPGQGLVADGNPLYIFIFESPADREDQTTDFDPTNPGLINLAGTPVAGGTPHVVAGSNILAVLLGGSADIAAKVDRAIKGLP